MERFTAITVGVDLGDPGTDALQQAARLAAKRGATLHAVHVVEELVVVDLAKSLGQEIAATRADVVRDAEAELARRCADLAMPGSSRRRVEIGLPWRELLAVGERLGTELHHRDAPGQSCSDRPLEVAAAMLRVSDEVDPQVGKAHQRTEAPSTTARISSGSGAKWFTGEWPSPTA